MNRCANNGCLVDTKLPLPTDPTELYVAPLPPVGCNKLRCVHCGAAVRNAPGLAFATRDDVSAAQLSELYDLKDLTKSRLIDTTHPKFRLYICRCSRWLENDHHFITTPDRDVFTDPNVPWRCDGHPPIQFPHDIHGVRVATRDELRDFVVRALHGFDPPGAMPDEKNAEWLRRLYYRLSPADAGLVAQLAAGSFGDADPVARQRALHFFHDVPDPAARERLADQFTAHRNLFAGIPDRSPRHTTDSTLEHAAWRLLHGSIPTSPRIRDLARAEALAGKASRALYDGIVKADARWLDEHVAEVARAAPDHVKTLEQSFRVTDDPAIYEGLRGRALKAVGKA